MADRSKGVDAEAPARLDLKGKGKTRDGATGGGGGGATGGAKGGAKGGGAQARHVQVSKALSRLLRHQADKAGIQLDDEGFAPLDKVLAWGPLGSLGVTLAEVQAIVAANDKQRFALKRSGAAGAGDSPSAFLVRANQGHSIRLESAALLAPVTLAQGNVPPRVLHGTYVALWPAIVASGGLRPMGRTHVHCSVGEPGDGAVVSGMRRDAELLVEIDVEASLRAGLRWWRSDNGVLLTEGGADGLVSTRFFKRVTGRTVDVGVLWEDGEKKADLPEGARGRPPPQGKGRGGPGRGRRRAS